jgi:hypothetical protein
MGTMARREVLGDGTFALRPTGKICQIVLAANTEQHFNIPTDTGVNSAVIVPMMALFEGTADFYVGYDQTAAVPGSSVTDGSGTSELNPTQRIVSKVTALSLISATTCVVTISFFS